MANKIDNYRPFFSIVVPMFNVEKYAKECIESILNQTYHDYEAILVDDGSTDETSVIIDMYVRKYPDRLKVVHKKNGGLVSARQAGLSVATGDFVVPLDGDDWINPTYLQHFKEAIDVEKAEMYCSGHLHVYADGIIKERHIGQNGAYRGAELVKLLENSMFSLNPNLWGKCVKTDYYRKFQDAIDPMIKMGEDGVVSYPMYAYAKCVVFLDKCLYNYRQVGTSMSHSKKKIIEWKQVIWRIHYLYEMLSQLKNRDEWMVVYSTHSSFNSIISIFQQKGYFKGRSEVSDILSDVFFYNLITKTSPYFSKEERIANLLIKHRYLILLSLIAKFRK